MMWGKWTWLQNEFFGINANGTNATEDAPEMIAIVALEEELNDFQPIYRNPLLQQLYKTNDDDCDVASDDSIFQFITIKHGAWIPSQQYLQEAVDFSWADFQTKEETEEQELEQTIDTEDITNDDQKKKKQLIKDIEKDRKKRKEERKKQKKNEQKQEQKDGNKQASRRRLLGKKGPNKNNKKGPKFFGGNHRFDPLHALPNPADIIKARHKGDEGAGDELAQRMREQQDDPRNMGQYPGGIVPPWLKNKDLLNKPQDFAKMIRDQLAMGNKKHLKHLDEIRKRNRGKGVNMKSPHDILSNLDLSKFGIKNPVNEQTTDKEKREDLKKLEEEEAKRHPYMTLLTNPGDMNDIKCIKNNYRKHELELKVLSKEEASTQINHLGTDSDGKKSIFSYDNNMLMWYCYLIQIQEDTIDDIGPGASYKVNLSFSDINLEIGFDFVEIYINSQHIDTISGIGLNWDEDSKKETMPSFIYYLNSDYVEQFGNSMEICLKIVTDSNIIKEGFKSLIRIDYDDPTITKWSDWTQCKTQKAGSYKGAKNDKHWSGDCGIGVRTKSVESCADSTSENNEDDNGEMMMNILDSDRAECVEGEIIKEYCVKANCFDFPMEIDEQHPELAFKFNGHGRVDPDYPDPFIIQRSISDSFNISYIINELATVRDEIINRYPDERILQSAVINHYYMDQSKLRLGIRLARSLLLGDTFTVYMTGSSNTAGHENMFMATWPMQFQSMMRPIWKRIGYKGAAFVVKNHAEGGAVSSMDLSWCIPSLIGDDADVVYWESQMNDHGAAVEHAIENHFRNSITLPRRPMYHVMHAGKNGPVHEGKYDAIDENDGIIHNEQFAYPWITGKGNNKPQHPGGKNPDYPGGILMEPYTDYGSGLMQFYPTNGLAAINRTKYQEFGTNYLYISWHPGPAGHRVYAEMLAYTYLSAVLQTLTDIKDLIDDLTPSDDVVTKPIEEMLEILEDPPTLKQLPSDFSAGQCDPTCTNATESVCISGYLTLGKPRYSLRRFREKESKTEDLGKWEYNNWMGNPQAFILKTGGQGSNDIKQQWQTTKPDSNELKFIFEAKQYGFISIEANDINKKVNKDQSVEIKINEIDMITGKVNDNNPTTFNDAGKPLKCDEKGNIDGKSYWVVNNMGCTIHGLKPYQKYQIVFNTLKNGEIGIKNIRIY